MRATMDESAYRPWHSELASQLSRAHEGGKLHHALLMAGPKWLGKRQFASQLIPFLLCQHPRHAEGLACGECKSCKLLSANTHPDFYQIGLEGDARQIAIDTVRAVREKLLTTAQLQGARVCLVDPADALNESSSNALLKLLEEPPANTFFVLVVDQPQYLLPTIRSRCLPIQFSLPEAGQLAAYLEVSDTQPELVSSAVEKSRGFPELALALLQRDSENAEDGELPQLSMPETGQHLASWLESRDGAQGEVDKELAELAKQSLSETIDQLQRELHSAYLASLQAVEPSRARAWPALSGGQFQALQEELLQARRDLLRNPNALLLLESLRVRCRQIAFP